MPDDCLGRHADESVGERLGTRYGNTGQAVDTNQYRMGITIITACSVNPMLYRAYGLAHRSALA
jgi:hypothetical protein